MTAARTLLAGIIDYAGLFPPAALDVPSAVRNYASYTRDRASWMLGRFVAPVARLNEVLTAWSSTGVDSTLRISATPGADVVSDISRLRHFNAAAGSRVIVDSIEAKLDTVDAIRAAADSADGFELFAEIPSNADPSPLVDAIAECDIRAKIRTGGVTKDAFPPADDVIRFIRCCLDRRVPFKATAGLHHPLRAEYRLTYDDGAACGSMYGFLNMFLAAALLREGLADDDAARLLLERHSSAFEWSDGAVTWCGQAMSETALADLRRTGALSFGSCSFREPVDELRTLNIIE